jgi:hypothetical protein
MMKSFFKKLAVVMALAMVVTAAAPAGKAALAAGLYVAFQNEKTAITELELEIGAKEDLCFKNAPTNWKESFSWTSADPSIATVDTAGIVTGLKDGVTVITCQVLDEEVDVIVTVGKGNPVVVTPSASDYTVVQKSHNVVEFVFDAKHSYKASDVQLYRVYEGVDTPIVWPLKDTATKVTDTTISVQPYVEFSDGDEYLVKIGSKDAGTYFTTKIGAVDQLVVTYKSEGKEMHAFTAGEEGTPIDVTFSTKLYSQGVDVTEKYAIEDALVYTLAEENEYVSIDEYGGVLNFYAADVTVVVVAEYTYYDANDEEHVVTQAVPVTSENVPAYSVTKVSDWAIVHEDAEKIDWTVKKIAANDDNNDYYIVLLLEDSYGNKVVVEDIEDKSFANSTNKWKDAEDTDYNFAAEGYYIEFTSANVGKMLVGTDDGVLTTYTEATVPVIVALKNTNLETSTQLVKNMYAATVNVLKDRAIDLVQIKDGAMTLLTDSFDDDVFTKGTTEVYVKDNYKDAWTKGDVNLTVTCSNADVQSALGNGIDIDAKYDATDKKATITLYGADIAQYTDASSVTFTFKHEDSGRTATLRVSLKNPRYEDANKTIIDVTSYALRVDDIDQKIEKQADGTTKYAKVNFLQLSNGYEVGYEDTTNVNLVTSADDLKLYTRDFASQEEATGTRYLVVYGPNGAIVGAGSDAALGMTTVDGQFALNVATIDAEDPDAMTYIAEGKYKVVVKELSTFNSKGEAKFRDKYTDTFTVNNKSAKLTFASQEEVYSESGDLAQIVKDTLKFNLDGKNWNYTVNDIDEVTYRFNPSSGYIVITKVKFNVPLNGSNDGIGYVKEVVVNKAIEVPYYTE